MPDQDIFINTLREWVEETMHRSMHAFIRHNRRSALSLSQANSLFRLYHHGASPVSDLADHLGITMAAVSQLLAPLDKSGLIQRTEDPADRRVKMIALTQKGILAVREAMHARHAWLEDLAALLTDREKETILPALACLNKYAHQLSADVHHYNLQPDPEKTKES